MNKGLLVVLFATGCLMGCAGGGESASRPAQVEDEPFPVLNAYGNWIDLAQYGRVWQPSVGGAWVPYTDGQWIWSDRGWMWESDEPYGWVVYHYGTWTQWGSLGWVWVPGYEWSPARVRWYYADDYVGWAPIPPPKASFPRVYEPGYERVWVIVPMHQFTDPHVGRLRVSPPPPMNVQRDVVHGPPDVQLIQRATTHEIRQQRTNTEQVREGRHTVTRVRVRTEEPIPPQPALPQQPVAQPANRPAPSAHTPVHQEVSPPPAAKPAAQDQKQRSPKREKGQAKPATVPGTPPGSSTPPAAKDSTRSVEKKPAPPAKPKPRTEERR